MDDRTTANRRLHAAINQLGSLLYFGGPVPPLLAARVHRIVRAREEMPRWRHWKYVPASRLVSAAAYLTRLEAGGNPIKALEELDDVESKLGLDPWWIYQRKRFDARHALHQQFERVTLWEKRKKSLYVIHRQARRVVGAPDDTPIRLIEGTGLLAFAEQLKIILDDCERTYSNTPLRNAIQEWSVEVK